MGTSMNRGPWLKPGEDSGQEMTRIANIYSEINNPITAVDMTG
jgi:hypothetical protein